MRRLSAMQKQDIKVRALKLQQDWLAILHKELAKEIEERDVVDSGDLLGSIQTRMAPNVMELSYKLYGAFVDMNVGAGRSLADNREENLVRRLHLQMQGRRVGRMKKRYLWYSRRMAREQHRLAELLAELYADASVDEIVNALPMRVEMKL